MSKITYEQAVEKSAEVEKAIQYRGDVIKQANAEIEQLVAEYNYLKGVCDALAPEEVEDTAEQKDEA